MSLDLTKGHIMKTLILLLALVSCESQLGGKGSEPEGREVVNMAPLDEREPLLVVGDSISIGYYLELQKLIPSYQVIHNTGNARNSLNGRNNIEQWLAHSPSWKACTLNHGLHDIHPFYRVSIEDYRDNLRFVATRMIEACEKVLFINTTKVPLDSPYRQAGLEITYNAAAQEVMDEMNIPVCDLHAASLLIPTKKPGNVHYKISGYKQLAQVIKGCLDSI